MFVFGFAEHEHMTLFARWCLVPYRLNIPYTESDEDTVDAVVPHTKRSRTHTQEKGSSIAASVMYPYTVIN